MRRSHRFRRRTSTTPSHRHGATMVEMAIVLLVFLMLVFGMLDLGLGVFRYNELAQASREVAREVVVHGAYADKLGVWGPGQVRPDGRAGHDR